MPRRGLLLTLGMLAAAPVLAQVQVGEVSPLRNLYRQAAARR